ncbi:MAG: pyridoxamine 5'-phosphate oxidase family protein [Oscillospiraceae bacterium]|nr:pyridoxamine 5'-phosphate oxidase family protein [Oscillospiraceae bacterium]
MKNLSFENYKKALSITNELFQKDYQFAMATTANHIPSLRFVDTYFYDGAFYILTYENTNKVKEINVNPQVALCSRKGYAFHGKAVNIGHPLLPENSEIKNKLIVAFKQFYFKHYNENDPICILKIMPENGFVYKDGIGYKIDFVNKTAFAEPFTFNTILTEE